ncbi:hypothetical protein HT118_19650 [Escherichia coli]|nr:hypothetical protein [Escherichia coli]
MKFTDLKIETQASHQRFFLPEGAIISVNMMNLHALPTSPRRWQCYDGGEFFTKHA